MPDETPSPAHQRRNLLPRWPPDPIPLVVLIGGLGAAFVAGIDPTYGAVPGALLMIAQKVSGHVLAWRIGGVERAFVSESSAISFYVVAVALFAAAVLERADLVRIETYWLFFVAVISDTTVRSFRESRYI